MEDLYKMIKSKMQVGRLVDNFVQVLIYPQAAAIASSK